MGVIGVSLTEFWNAEFRELSAISDGYSEKVEQSIQTEWEVARFIVVNVCRSNGAKVSMKDYKFPWEKGTEILTKEEIDRNRRKVLEKYG